MMAAIKLLPDWRAMFMRIRLDVERRRSRCHPSGSMPSSLAKATRFTAILMSWLAETIAILYLKHRLADGLPDLRVGLHRLNYGSPDRDVFRIHVKVEGGSAVQLPGYLANELQVTAHLAYPSEGGKEVLRLLSLSKRLLGSALQCLHTIE